MDKKKKQIVLLAGGLVVLVVVWTVVLMPKKPSVPAAGVVAGQAVGSDKTAAVQDVNLVTLEDALGKVQTSVGDITKKMEQPAPSGAVGEPFAVPGRGTAGTGGILAVASVSPDVPTFTVSGIVYDKVRPFAVIDNEVKTENEFKAGFLVYRIMKEQVLLKKKNRVFVLKVNSGGSISGQDGIMQLSDSDAVEAESSLMVKVDTDRKEYPSLSVKTILRNKEVKKSTIKPEAATAPLAPAVTPGFEEARDRASAKCGSRNDVRQPGLARIDTEGRGPRAEGSASGPDVIRTVQVASFSGQSAEPAVRLARELSEQGYEDVRSEYINGVYTVRVGRFEAGRDAREIYQELRKTWPTCFVRKAYYIEERIVYPEKS